MIRPSSEEVHLVTDTESYDRMLAIVTDAAWLIGTSATTQAEMNVARSLAALLRFLHGHQGELN